MYILCTYAFSSESDGVGAVDIELAGARAPEFLTAWAREAQHKFNTNTL